MADTYTGTEIPDLDILTPREGSSTIGELNDAIREVKKCVVNSYDDLLDRGLPFVVTGTITSAAAGTAVVLIPNSSIPTGRKIYVTGFHAKVDGATTWLAGGCATMKIQDTASVDFFTINDDAMVANSEIRPGQYNATNDITNIVAEDAYLKGTGGTANKGLQLKGSANGTGSDLIVTVYGLIK